MDHILAQQPAIISSMKRLEDEYMLLIRRRSTLLSELRNNSQQSKSVRKLRQSELRYLSSHLAKIEYFLKRYGFMDSKRTIYNDDFNYST